MTDDLHHLTAAHAVDALDPLEARRYEAHLATCERCRVELGELRAAASQLAAAAIQSPPAGLRARVLSEVAATAQERRAPVVAPARRHRSLVPALAAAAVLIVVAVAGLAIRDLAVERDRAEQLAAVLTADDARTSVLDGDDGGDVRVVWSASTSAAVLVGSGLEPADDGRVYELWAFAEDGPRSAGVFEPGSDGRVRRRVDLPAEPVDGWGVTMEPIDGTPEPEGAVVYQST